MSFDRFGLYSSILRAVAAKGYTTPTPVQEQAIPSILNGKDLIASAQTGTGKTAAFALPILNRLGPHQAAGPRVLVLEPTRELAAQVEEAFRELGQHTDLRVALLHGGVKYGKQRTALREGSDIVVATVGRLLDHIEAKALRLDYLHVLVLDEVDRMLDLGFIKEVRRIVGLCPPKRQSLLFSATVPTEIEELAQFALRNPVRIEIGSARNESITHALYPVRHVLKFPLLLALLAKLDYKSIIVFTRTKNGADRIAEKLLAEKHSVAVLHGDRSQGQRREALTGFKEGRYEVLVATDIAARGLDVEGVSHVVNYDVPAAPEDYVHRIGRTGRAAQVGDALTLVTPQDAAEVRAIEKLLGTPLPQVELEGFDYDMAAPPDTYRGRDKHAAAVEAKREPAPYHPKGKPGAHWKNRGRR